jgi:ribonuclease inhibitor
MVGGGSRLPGRAPRPETLYFLDRWPAGNHGRSLPDLKGGAGMPVKKYVLDGQAIQSLDSFYKEIAKVLPLPDYFGRNLDALADVLTTDLAGPCEILWEKSALSKQAMNRDFQRIRSVLKHVAQEREDIKIVFR